MNLVRRILHYTIVLILFIQLVACAFAPSTYGDRKQIEEWDMSGVISIAIPVTRQPYAIPDSLLSDIPATLRSRIQTSVHTADIYYNISEYSLCAYVGSEAMKIIQEIGKFTVVTDSKTADAVLECDIISVHEEPANWVKVDRFGYSENMYRSYWTVIYNITIKRTSDGSIIGDCAGIGHTYINREHAGMANSKNFKELINITHLRQALGIKTL